MVEETLIFIDEGFLSQLSKHLGKGGYERKRDSKFSVSHHLIDCCKETFYLNKKHFEEAKLEKQ